MKIKSSLIFQCPVCMVPTPGEDTGRSPREFTRHVLGLPATVQCPDYDDLTSTSKIDDVLVTTVYRKGCKGEVASSLGKIARRKLTSEDMRRMNVPDRFWGARQAGVQKQSKDLVDNYLTNFDLMAEKGAGLVLWGPVGRGKTSIAVTIAKEARARGYSAYFTSVYELREAIKNKAEFDDQAILSRCRDVDVLIVDNVEEGDLNITHYFSMHDLKALVRFRGEHLKITIVTTRQNPATDFEGLSTYMVSVPVGGEDLNPKQGLQAIVQPKKGS